MSVHEYSTLIEWIERTKKYDEIETDSGYNPKQERKLLMNGNTKRKMDRKRAKEMKELRIVSIW